MIGSRLKFHTFLSIALLVCGCAANVLVEDVTPLEFSLSSYDKALVDVQAKSQSIKNAEGFTLSKAELESQFISNLQNKKLFEVVSNQALPDTNEDTLRINLIVEDFNYVSGASSVMFGIMTGNARLSILAQLIDADTGRVLGEIRSGAKTKSSGGIFRGSTGTLISAITEQLVNEISSYK